MSPASSALYLLWSFIGVANANELCQERTLHIIGDHIPHQNKENRSASGFVSQCLRKDAESRRRDLHIRTYAVIPLNEECGIIEWVNNTAGLRHILTKLYKEKGLVTHLAPYTLYPVPYTLFPVPYSLFLIPCSLYPVPYTLFPFHYSLFPIHNIGHIQYLLSTVGLSQITLTIHYIGHINIICPSNNIM